jgi:manganese/zinc/iron transport system ATP- binding protein
MLPLSIRELGVRYGEVVALDGASFDVVGPSLTAVVGPNGAGKSTLMRAVLGLVPHAGTVEIFGRSAISPRRVAWVPQRSVVDTDFPISVSELVTQGRYPHLGAFGRVRDADRRAIADALEATALTPLAARPISQLSGGQLQRAFVARALAQQADLYFLDEPFAGIDASNEAAIVEVLQRLRDSGKTVVVVHHDLSTVRSIFDRVVLLNRRCIASGTVDEAFTLENLRLTYGERLAVIASSDGSSVLVP